MPGEIVEICSNAVLPAMIEFKIFLGLQFMRARLGAMA